MKICSPVALSSPVGVALAGSRPTSPFYWGGAWLLYRRVFTWHAPVAMLAALAVCALMGYDGGSSQSGGSALFHLFSGATMFAAFFIITDPVSSAVSNKGRLIFGALIGVLIYLIRTLGNYPDAVAFAVLILNFLCTLYRSLHPAEGCMAPGVATHEMAGFNRPERHGARPICRHQRRSPSAGPTSAPRYKSSLRCGAQRRGNCWRFFRLTRMTTRSSMTCLRWPQRPHYWASERSRQGLSCETGKYCYRRDSARHRPRRVQW